MAYTPGDKYVTPTGIGLYNNLFGQSQTGGPSNFFGDGGMFGANPFAASQQAWARQMFGLGVAPETDQLRQASLDSSNRYFGDPSTGQGGWDDRWNQWFGTGGTDPRSGEALMSPFQVAGLRATQTDYGARNADGSVRGPAGGDIFQGFTWNQNQLADNPLLDPTQSVEGFRSLMSGSPYDMPNPGDYTNSMRSAIGDAGEADIYGQRGLGQNRDLAAGTNFDQYGLRGIDQTNSLEEANVRQLMRGIDRESELTLAQQLPEIQQSMEAAGLGRSGANQSAMLGSMRSVMEQANRDKQRTMADFQDRSANRRAQAINLATQQGYGGEGQKFGALSQAMNLGSQIGAQGQQNFANLMGQSSLAGLGDQFRANQSMRDSEMGLYGQGVNNANQRYGWDTGNYLQALIGGGQYQLGALDAERMGQSQGLNDYMNLVNNREGWRSNSLNEMLGLSDRERSIQQDILNQQMQAGFMPLDLMTRLTTGISGSNYSPQQSAPWWAGAVGGVANGVGNAVGEGAGSWLSKQFGNA